MLVRHVLSLLVILFATTSTSFTIPGRPGTVIKTDKRELLQDLVTWDQHSLFVRGERILFYSGEFHPFRLPVPSLWIDVFQKIKALGFSGVSFYVDWALVEGQPGEFRANGIFDLDPFFAAAKAAGIYLLARPGPYINAEASGGGYPGWLQRIKGILRTNATDYLAATNNYAANVNAIIAKAQITNDGPVILYQPENEYTYPGSDDIVFPNREYFAYVEKQARDAGIVVPFINNDASPQGIFAPGSGVGSVDIYGHDSYPLGFDCQNPTVWPDNQLPTNFRTLHEEQSPLTPYSLVEFQGGSFDPWGGADFSRCLQLVNAEFERVFYKNDFSFGVTIVNYYMIYGGTNWGNLGHPGGYTSYDYGASIAENLSVSREKFSEAKVLANMLRSFGDAYLTATPGNASNGSFVDTNAIAVTPLWGANDSNSNFYVVRHAAYNSIASTLYRLTVSTSLGNVTIPQKNNFATSLTLNGRDSKIHVTDFNVGSGIDLLYSSAEIFTWQQDSHQNRTVLVLFGGDNEVHEYAIKNPVGANTSSGSVAIEDFGKYTVAQFNATPGQQQTVYFEVSGLLIYMLARSDVYNWWTLELEASAPLGNFTSPSKSQVIVTGGALMRTASVQGSNLYLTGDLNAGSNQTSQVTYPLEIIAGVPQPCNVYFNDEEIPSSATSGNASVATTQANATYSKENLGFPKVTSQQNQWRSIDSLPEVSNASYDDSFWTVCNHSTSNNPLVLSTPYSLYASDYGYNGGSILYRGHFSSSSQSGSPNLTLLTQGGYAFGYSVFLNSRHIHSYPGVSTAENATETIPLPSLNASTAYVVTVVIDHMGLTENFNPGADTMKEPRGILSYNLTGYAQSDVTWKITGNLGGEAYRDLTRGPLNEGGFFVERQGYHLPGAPTSGPEWSDETISESLSEPGVKFYVTTFPISTSVGNHAYAFVFNMPNTTATTSAGETAGRPLNFRAVLYVNGYQFGKYVNNIGPQTQYPIPQGILGFNGTNTLGVLVWNMEANNTGADAVKWDGLGFILQGDVLTGRPKVVNSPMDGWAQREGAY